MIMETLDSNDGAKKVIVLRSPVAVKDLAALLGRKPFQIVADLVDLGVIANRDQFISFEVAAKVAQKCGFDAKRIGYQSNRT